MQTGHFDLLLWLQTFWFWPEMEGIFHCLTYMSSISTVFSLSLQFLIARPHLVLFNLPLKKWGNWIYIFLVFLRHSPSVFPVPQWKDSLSLLSSLPFPAIALSLCAPSPLQHWPSQPRVRPERGLCDLQLCLLSTQTSVRTAGRVQEGQIQVRHECT